MYDLLDGWINGWMDYWMGAWLDGQGNEWIHFKNVKIIMKNHTFLTEPIKKPSLTYPF